jgi:NitT/TauT family transport system substrate-binding protein
MFQRILLLLALVLGLAACGGAADTSEDATTDQDLRPVTMALAYIPNVQFAPFYVADSKGYFADAGLDVEFDYNFETDVTQRVAAWPDSEVEFAMSGGLSVMLARQQGLPVVMVMTQYQQFPVVFFGKSMLELEEPEDLQNKSIGIPGRFGASYYALQALLYASDLEESDLDIQEVGFNQFQLVLEDNIDVASGYAMNEPVKLHEEGWQVDMLRVADYYPLVSDGIVTSEALLENEPDLARSFVQAALRGLQDTLDNPDEAFEISLEYIPEADLGNPDFERTVLQESLPYWEAERLGYSSPRKWEQSYVFLNDLGLVGETVQLDEAYTNEFVE